MVAPCDRDIRDQNSMENIMDQLPETSSGSLDLDLYQQNAAAICRQGMRRCGVPSVTDAGALVVAGSLGLVLMAGSAQTMADRMAAASLRASVAR
jgi:hypothetical protein